MGVRGLEPHQILGFDTPDFWTCVILGRGIRSFSGHFFELDRASEVEGRMAPDGIVEPVNVAANGLGSLLAGVEVVRHTSTDFSVLKNVSTMALS